MKLSEIAKAFGLAPDAGEAKVREALTKVASTMTELANAKAAADKAASLEASLANEQAARKASDEALANERKANVALREAIVGEALRDGKLHMADKTKAFEQIANEAGAADKILRGEVKLHVANCQVSGGVANRQGRENPDADAAVANAHTLIQARAMKDGIDYQLAYFRLQAEGGLPFRKSN